MAGRNFPPAFARRGESDPRGKCDERIDIPVPESVKDDAIFIARAHGKTVSEWVRDVLYRELYGQVAHIQMLVQTGPEVHGSNRGGSSDER